MDLSALFFFAEMDDYFPRTRQWTCRPDSWVLKFSAAMIGTTSSYGGSGSTRQLLAGASMAPEWLLVARSCLNVYHVFFPLRISDLTTPILDPKRLWSWTFLISFFFVCVCGNVTYLYITNMVKYYPGEVCWFICWFIDHGRSTLKSQFVIHRNPRKSACVLSLNVGSRCTMWMLATRKTIYFIGMLGWWLMVGILIVTTRVQDHCPVVIFNTWSCKSIYQPTLSKPVFLQFVFAQTYWWLLLLSLH